MIYAALGALVVGLSLGVFGSGGSILTLPVLVYLLRHDDKTAIAESLAIVGGIALVGAARNALEKFVAWHLLLLFGLPAMVGTLLGSFGARHVPGHVQLVVFAIVMLTAAVMMWRRARPPAKHTESTEPAPKQPRVALIPAQGVSVGAMTGFVGVGGGFLIVPALVLLTGLQMRRAVATSLAIITMNCAVGFWRHHADLSAAGNAVDWPTIALFILIGAVGTLAGKAIGSKINQRALQRGFAVFLLLMGVLILARETSALI